jgi:hypothetical protein
MLTALFLGTLWYWMKYSQLEKAGMRRAGNLKVVGYAFIMLASWFICGIVGPPGSAARPEIMMVESVVAPSYAVMLFLFIGFLSFFLGQRAMYRAKRTSMVP